MKKVYVEEQGETDHEDDTQENMVGQFPLMK